MCQGFLKNQLYIRDICETLNFHLKMPLNVLFAFYKLRKQKCTISILKKLDCLFILTFLAARSCESSRAAATPRLMVTGHPSLALTPLGTGSTVGPWEAGWESTHTHTRQFTLMLKDPLFAKFCSFTRNFLCPIHTHVCRTWLLSSLAHTHSGPSHGGNPSYGHSRTSAHSPHRRIP